MARSGRESDVVTGLARVDNRTKRLVKRVQPGEVMVIDHADLDRVAAETIVEAQAGAVINVAESITGRYPNLGPLLVCAAGIPLLDGVGQDVLEAVAEGEVVTVAGNQVIVGGSVVATGTRQSMQLLEDRIERARQSMGEELERFAENTLSYLTKERHLLLDEPDIPDIDIDMKGRHVLIVVRGAEYKEDLDTLRRSGYLGEMQPLLVGVDGGADALLEIGQTPDLIIGDMDSVSERALRCGAALVVHGYQDGRAPGAQRLEELGLDHVIYAAAGTSEDIAMLLAYEKGAELIVAVGTHSSMVEFFDKGRAGMASTFLVRMKVGPILVDAKGVSRLYQHRVRKGDLAMLVLSAVFTLVVITMISEPVRLVLRGYWLTLTS
ncbi:MAG TPA: putative cytokinetic ring protein SteA [Acidimicrobiales bacterium]|nr:putative cytokinetic ring protein SteA [Acidimicrobiales bacterium]